MSDSKIQIENKESIFSGTEKNKDGSPIQVVTENGKPTFEIKDKESILSGTEKNKDGSSVKVVTPTK